MKPIFIIAITLLLIGVAISSTAQIESNWLHNIKAERYSHVMDFIEVEGNIYVSHCAYGNIEDEDYKNIISEKKAQASLVKLDKSGKVIWKNTVISNESRITSILKTNDGNITAIGYSRGQTEFTSVNGKKIFNESENCFLFINNYTPSGKLINIEILEQKEGRRSLYPTSSATNSKGELFVGINFYGQLINQENAVENTAINTEYSGVLKFTKEGKFVEIIKHWELVGTRAQVDIDIDTKDNLIISGYSRGTVHLSKEVKLECSEGDIYAANTSYSFIAKYSPNKELLWHQKIGGRNNQMITGLVLSSKDEIYLCGTYSFECIFSNAVSVNNTKYERRFEGSIFYAKLGSEGDISFVKYYRSKGGNACASGSLSIDENDFIHMTGAYNGILDFNSTQPVRIGEILGNSPTPQSSWRVNTRGNSAWFYSIWKDDTNLYCQNLYNLNGYPNANYVKKVVAHNGSVLMGGFYHIGKPSLIASPKNIELGASGDSGMYSIFVSATIPALALPVYSEIEQTDTTNLVTNSLYYPTAVIKAESDSIKNTKAITRTSDSAINSIQPNLNVNIYPNPTTDIINIRLDHFAGWVDLMLISPSGSVVYSQSITKVTSGETLQLNVSSMASGTYYLVVIGANFKKSYAVVKIG
jgi:hypothetical protein